MRATTALLAVKLVHTLAWALLAACIVALPFAAHARRFDLAAWLAGIVLAEVLVLAANGWRCPLTDVAARYTTDRHDNFDIFLPLWLARYNKPIFGTLYVAGLAYAGLAWW